MSTQLRSWSRESECSFSTSRIDRSKPSTISAAAAFSRIAGASALICSSRLSVSTGGDAITVVAARLSSLERICGCSLNEAPPQTRDVPCYPKAVREHRDITLGLDVLTRISAVLGIHQALQILNAKESDGVAWLRRPHRSLVFGGKPPLELIASGSQDALITVRRFLKAARGGLYLEPNEIDRAFTPYSDKGILFS